MAKKLIAIRLDEEVINQLKQLAKLQKRSQGNTLELLIEQAYKQHFTSK